MDNELQEHGGIYFMRKIDVPIAKRRLDSPAQPWLVGQPQRGNSGHARDRRSICRLGS